MALQLRRGLEANRSSVTPAEGELLYTTDQKKVYIGDGTTAGGNLLSSDSVQAFADLASFPVAGKAGVIYIAIDTNFTYRWSGSAYIVIGSALTSKGAYAGGTTYAINDLVTYNGSSYLCIAPTTGNLPTDGTYWVLLAAKGDTGPAGAAGADGAAGANSYTYIGYASDASGTGFTTTFNAALDYIAIRSSNSVLTPVVGDFAGLWKNYKGATGAAGAAGADGADGADGASSYTYISYASADDGTDFTTTFNASLDYIAIRTTTSPLTPVVGDFAGLWKKYKGETGLTGATGSPGMAGADGASSYTYIAYASADDGTDFTTTFNPALNYIAIITSATPLTPVVGDFAGMWKNYKGATGATGAPGAPGADGDNAYVYIAYASDDAGTGFTTTFSAALDYIAIKNSATPLTPVVGDFAGLWTRYQGSGASTAGVAQASDPSFTDNGDGTCNVGQTIFNIFSTTDFTGHLYTVTVPAATNIGPFDGSGKYLAVDWNGGSPIWAMKTSAQINGSSIVPVFKCWWDGTYLHSLSNDSPGLGLANKISTMIAATHPYQRAGNSGLVISESATRIVEVTQGYVFAGTFLNNISAYTSATDIFTKASVATGTWTYDRTATQYNNTQYNPVGGLTTLTNNYYMVIWLFRSIGDVKEVFAVQGTNEYQKIADARLEPLRTDLPALITQHCLLVGRIIVQKGASSGEVASAFSVVFQGNTVISHNDTTGKQGGDAEADEFYHMTAAENTGTGTGVFVRKALPTLDGVKDSTLTANTTAYVDGNKQLKSTASGTTTQVLHGNPSGAPTYGAVVEADLGFTDVTTGNATTGQHGLLPKLSGTPTEFLNGQGNFSSVAAITALPGYLSQTFSSQTTVVVSHNFGAYPAVQILDGSGYQLIPLNIQHTSNNQFTVTFSASTSGRIIASAGTPAVPNVITTATSYAALLTDNVIVGSAINITITLPNITAAYTGLSFSAASGEATITRNAHGFVNGSVVVITNTSDAGLLPNGTYVIYSVAANTFKVLAGTGTGSGTADASLSIATGKEFTIDNDSSGNIFVTGSQTIQGVTTQTIPSQSSMVVYNTGSKWRIK